MSHFYCDKCGKVKRGQFHHFDHHGHNDFHHHDNFHNCDCDDCRNKHRHDFICDRIICDDDFRLRLGGLQGGLNFRLRQHVGCKVKLELEGGRKIQAKICFVGSDFIEAEVIEPRGATEQRNNENNDNHQDREDHENIENRRQQRNNRNKRRQNNRDKALIVPFSGIKSVELRDDCNCGPDVECNCHD
ncbi:hypothetical protein [Bacillus sp. JJ1562]|uniref:hypothetical protein n=1 Tax=Bacillus sp. JJ1562 TaxID=3122960 RepID=UPI0030034667